MRSTTWATPDGIVDDDKKPRYRPENSAVADIKLGRHAGTPTYKGRWSTWYIAELYTQLLESSETATKGRNGRVIQHGQRMSDNYYIGVDIIMIKKQGWRVNA